MCEIEMCLLSFRESFRKSFIEMFMETSISWVAGHSIIADVMVIYGMGIPAGNGWPDEFVSWSFSICLTV